MKHLEQQADIFCLNHGWKFIESDISVLPDTRQHDDIYGFAKGGACKGPADTSFDDSAWEDVNLPHDWVTKKDFDKDGSPNFGYKERGRGWYRIRFNLPIEDMKKQILLEFEGMSCNSEIYVNGMLLKRNHSGYNSFSVDMTEVAHYGVVPNVLAVFIDASAWEGWWYEGAGIYRNVWLLKKSAVHVEYNRVYVKSDKISDKQWNNIVDITLENSFEDSKECTVVTELFDHSDKPLTKTYARVNICGFSSKTIEQKLKVTNPNLWDVESPKLYTAKVSVYYDDEIKDFEKVKYGYRSIEFDAEKGFFLNGRSLKIKGFCNHQDHAGIGVAVPYSIKEYRIKLLKELGANAYRLAHNPDPEIIEICDRLGMMVMDENRTFNGSEETVHEVEEIVRAARNHPSVIMYSVFNEEPLQGTVSGHRIAGKLKAAVKRMDRTRPVLGAFNGGYMESDGAATIVDMVGINYNPARYDEFHKKFPHIPLVGSETASAFMVRGEYKNDEEKHLIDNYDETCALWGNTVRDAWKYVNERDFVMGAFVWTGFDYRGEPTPFEWPSVSTFFGTYDSCGFEKDACYLYKAFWKDEPIVHILPHWTLKEEEGTMIKVMVMTNCKKVSLYLNDKLIGTKVVTKYDSAHFDIPYVKGCLKAVGYISDRKAAEDVVMTAQKPEELIIESSTPEMNNDGHDAALINVSLVDKNGTVIPDAEDLVRFNVSGGAKIIGVGNGNPNSHEMDVADHRKLFHGKAQLIVLNDGDEDVRITASISDSINSSINIKVKEAKQIPYVKPVKEQIIDGWTMYYKLFNEMPEANPKVDKNDMNSFEPITFNGSEQSAFANQLNKYGLYRAEFEFSKEKNTIYISDIRGYVWIYLNGSKVFERQDGFGGYAAIDVDGKIHEKQVITIIIKNANKEWPYAGICSPVVIR